MLISFSVSNFRSFDEGVTLEMVASTKRTDHTDHLIQIDHTDKHVVRAAMLYGPNAAGKSNQIKAMRYAQNLIRAGGQSRLPIKAQQVIQAAQRARELDDGTSDIPKSPGTGAHKLIDTLQRRDSIEVQ